MRNDTLHSQRSALGTCTRDTEAAPLGGLTVADTTRRVTCVEGSRYSLANVDLWSEDCLPSGYRNALAGDAGRNAK